MTNASGESVSDGTPYIGNVVDFMASFSNVTYIDPLLAATASGKGANCILTNADFH
jgi:hypothetical protein